MTRRARVTYCQKTTMKPTESLRKYFFLIFVCMAIACTSNLHKNEIALLLIRMEKEGRISQPEAEKELFFMAAKSKMFDSFKQVGFSHRIQEMTTTWRLYHDKNYLIITGSVAKSDNDIYMFVIVYQWKNEGWEIVYTEIGDTKVGVYPENIIPFAKADGELVI